MRHMMRGYKLGRVRRERLALIRNLAISLILHESIKTTLAKAKALQPFIEKLITTAKVNTLQTKRSLMSDLNNNQKVVSKMLELIGPRFKNRNGGYTRIIKAGFRAGDSAPAAIIALVEQTTPEEATAILAKKAERKVAKVKPAVAKADRVAKPVAKAKTKKATKPSAKTTAKRNATKKAGAVKQATAKKVTKPVKKTTAKKK